MGTGRGAWLGTSWKMTKFIGQAIEYAKVVRADADEFAEALNLFLIPPHTALQVVADVLADSAVEVGAQNAHWAPQGAHTGDISMDMVRDAGARIVELGHSEIRSSRPETDAVIAKKVRAALDNALRPLVCVGEPAEERRWGTEVAYVGRQTRIAMTDVSAGEVDQIMVAYEPVWAIGASGTPASPDQAAEMLGHIRRELHTIFGDRAQQIPLLYGGGVSPTNAVDFWGSDHVDGLFVGRAALDPVQFLRIARSVAALTV